MAMNVTEMNRREKEFLDVEQAAVLLNRSAGSLRNMVMRRQVPFRKLAGRLVFLRSELERLIQTSPGMTFEELHSSIDEVE